MNKKRYNIVKAPEFGDKCVRLLDIDGNDYGAFVNGELASGTVHFAGGCVNEATTAIHPGVTREFDGCSEDQKRILERHRKKWGCPHEGANAA